MHLTDEEIMVKIENQLKIVDHQKLSLIHEKVEEKILSVNVPTFKSSVKIKDKVLDIQKLIEKNVNIEENTKTKKEQPINIEVNLEEKELYDPLDYGNFGSGEANISILNDDINYDMEYNNITTSELY